MTLTILLVAGLLAGCTSDGTDEEVEDGEIRLTTHVWQVMEGTRATTFDTQTALQTEGRFTCQVYQANSTTPYISATPVDWQNSQWSFSDGKHYWPATGALDFFAYMPATCPAYITSITYAVSGSPAAPAPQFTCDMSKPVVKEFIYALKTDQDKAGTNSSAQPTPGQVALNFQHPFARIIFQAATSSTYTINSVSLAPGFHQTGTCTFDGSTSTWSDLSTETYSPSISFGDPILVIPDGYGSLTLTANVTWTDWSNVTKDISATATFNLAAGSSYTYTISMTKEQVLQVSTEKYTEQW